MRKKIAQLSAQQREAVRLIAAFERNGRIAERVGVHRGTLWRWMQNDAFKAAVNAMVEQNLNELRRNEQERIRRLLNSDDPYVAQDTACRALDAWERMQKMRK